MLSNPYLKKYYQNTLAKKGYDYAVFKTWNDPFLENPLFVDEYNELIKEKYTQPWEPTVNEAKIAALISEIGWREFCNGLLNYVRNMKAKARWSGKNQEFIDKIEKAEDKVRTLPRTLHGD